VVRLKEGTGKMEKAADERRHLSQAVWHVGLSDLSVSWIASALGWVFDEDELDPLPGCG
jgi:hypothetical protein